jgi:hypothetical protein
LDKARRPAKKRAQQGQKPRHGVARRAIAEALNALALVPFAFRGPTAPNGLKWHGDFLPLNPEHPNKRNGVANTVRGLPRRVFDTIVSRFASRSGDVARFTATRYSFEVWLNWEAYAACVTSPGWQVFAKPRYCDLGADGCRDFGDLLVVDRDAKLLVEIGLVHDGTGNKWRDKLEWDIQKLARPLKGVLSLHVVVLVSSSSIRTSGVWQRWLETLPCWSRLDPFEASEPLTPNGEMVLRGWAGQCAGGEVASR